MRHWIGNLNKCINKTGNYENFINREYTHISAVLGYSNDWLFTTG